jgi:class 3 adenylate cyclase/alpha-beta hydrolase superfamily lysophospholipase
MHQPEIGYAKSGDVHVAYRVLGEGPMDLVIVPGFVSHLEIMWENPGIRRFGERLGRIARVIVFDKRGTGMSDPVEGVPTLEDRMDDVRAVMDAAGCERAALMGFSEGAPMSILFAATYPERTIALALCGGMARSTWAPDYPWASPREALLESAAEFMAPYWGTGENAEIFAPSIAGDPGVREWWGRLQRISVSPAMMFKLVDMFLDIDVRDVLPLVQAPTLVLHRHGDRVVNVGAGRWLAEHIKGARFVELPGIDHVAWSGDVDAIVGEVEEFLTGTRGPSPEERERVLATVMFTDLVASTERAAALGDRRWRDLLESYYRVVRRQLERFRGREVKTIGDGFLACFDGPARAIRSAEQIVSEVRDVGLEVRAGLHTGECELIGDDVGGIAVHIGARVASLAAPGHVLVSSTVKDLVAGSGIEFADAGSHILKGVPGEWRLFTVTSTP